MTASRHQPWIDVRTLRLWAKIDEACRRTAKVSVLAGRVLPGDEIEGVARHVVAPDHDGFADEWTPDCRLRITSTFEIFIPLRDVNDIYLIEES